MNALIVTVLYRQSLFNSNIYLSLLTYHKDRVVLIYDNSPNPLHKAVDFPAHWIYISDTSNPGLSKAYNTAATFAKINGFEWLILTDQDTILPKTLLSTYKNAIHSEPNIKLFAPLIKEKTGLYLSPVPINHYITKLTNIPVKGNINLSKYTLINSGLCINVEAFLSVGGYNESVFLDYSDIQFISNFSKKYDKGFIVNLIGYQNFSNTEHNINEKIRRFKLFCQSIKGFCADKNSDHKWIKYIVLKRALSLSFQAKNISPIKIFFNHYLK